MTVRLPLFLIFSSFLGVFPGARIFSYVASKIYYANTGKESYGGLVFYGGLLGFLTVFYLLQKMSVNSQSKVLWDGAALAIPLFHTFGRIGCAFSGCCFGIESHFGFTVHGNVLSPAVNDVCRFPVQLLEAALNLVLFAIFRHLLKKDRFKGGLFPMYLLSYSVIRFCDEFLRGDIIRGHVGLLSTSQWISIYIAILGTVWIIISRKIKCSAALRK